MLLDLNNLSSDQILQIDKIFSESEEDFQTLIENIYKKNDSNTDLIFSNIISRSNDENKIFYNLCLIELSLNLYKDGKISKIITSNKFQAEILKQKIKNIKIEIKAKNKINFFNKILKIVKNFHYIWKLRSFRDIKRKDKIKNLKKITLIELFFVPNMFLNNVYKDRYYGDLSLETNSNLKKNIFFFPIFFQNALKKKFIKLAEKQVNLILPSDYLKLKDYFNSIFYFLRVKRMNINNLKFKGLIVDDLVKAILNDDKFNQSSLIALLNFYCFKRMKEENLDLSLVIDWYENQIVDKGLNYAKNIFFSKTKSKGYIGSNPVLELNKNFIPSTFEITKKMVPDQICLISPKYFEFYKHKRKDINFNLAPYLRNPKLFKNENLLINKNKTKKPNKILINFTGYHSDNLDMINLINKCEVLKSNNISLYIRPHKASKKVIFKKLLSKDFKYTFSNKDFYDEIKDTDILISRPNTACFEALAFGVPVFITRRLRGFLPPKVSRNLFSEDWFFCNDAVELSGNIENTLKSKNKYNFKNFDDRKKLLNKHFMPINKENIINFLR